MTSFWQRFDKMKPTTKAFLLQAACVLIYASYGATMVLILQQWPEVGPWASLFRFIAWQIVLLVVVYGVSR